MATETGNISPQAQALEWANKGQALRAEKRFDEALECYRKATDLDPQLVRAWYDQGGLLESLQKLSDAAVCYQKVVTLDPSHSSAWHGVGFCFLQQQRYKEALLCFNKVVECNPRHARAWHLKAKCLMALRDFDEALIAFDKALNADPKYVPAWDELGTCMATMGNHEEALSYFDEALSRDKRYHVAWIHRGISLNALNRYEEAVDALQNALRINPNDAVAHYHLAESLTQLDRNEEALNSYNRALEKRLDFPDALYGKTALLRNSAKHQEALATIGQFFSFASPEHHHFNTMRKWMEEAGGEKKKPDAPAAASGDDGKFEVQQVLDRGGLSDVYLVRPRAGGQPLVLKSFTAKYVSDPAQRFLFRREAKSWIDLGAHPNIVQAYFVEDFRGMPSIGLEYITPVEPGLFNLQDYLEKRPPDSSQIRKWALEICKGMAHAHAKGMQAHRDLKPANVLIGSGGEARVTDFAVAMVVGMGSATEIRLNLAGDRPRLSWQGKNGYGFGTPTHMPPEQFANAASCDQRSDIYSFGVLLFEMVSRRLPFSTPVPPDESSEHAWEYWETMARLHREAPVPQLDSPFDPVIRRCLQKDPAKRYPSFTEALRDLEALQ